MQTVFSHIVQKRFSRVNEDVATDALAFVLHSSESARNGMMRFLRGSAPNLPSLRFRTQQTEGSIRPDMWGYDEAEPRVFVENKFWAGLTDNQPVSYLKQLAGYTQPTILLVVVPDAREQTMRRELSRRLQDGGISTTDRDTTSDSIVNSITTEIGPILAITSWTRLLSVLELEVANDPSARSDLLQLRALCEAADSDAFIPILSVEVGEIAKALIVSWKVLDEEKLRSYAAKIGNSAVAKRLGFLMETLGLGDVEVLRKEAPLAPGFSPLDPTLPKRGKYNRRWGLLVNAEMQL